MATRLNPNPNTSGKKNAQLGYGTRVRHRHITTMRPPYQLRTSYSGPVWLQTRGVKGASALLGISSNSIGQNEKKGKKKGGTLQRSRPSATRRKKKAKKANMVMQNIATVSLTTGSVHCKK